jgi:hypothetical protein
MFALRTDRCNSINAIEIPNSKLPIPLVTVNIIVTKSALITHFIFRGDALLMSLLLLVKLCNKRLQLLMSLLLASRFLQDLIPRFVMSQYLDILEFQFLLTHRAVRVPE